MYLTGKWQIFNTKWTQFIYLEICYPLQRKSGAQLFIIHEAF